MAKRGVETEPPNLEQAEEVMEPRQKRKYIKRTREEREADRNERALAYLDKVLRRGNGQTDKPVQNGDKIARGRGRPPKVRKEAPSADSPLPCPEAPPILPVTSATLDISATLATSATPVTPTSPVYLPPAPPPRTPHRARPRVVKETTATPAMPPTPLTPPLPCSAEAPSGATGSAASSGQAGTVEGGSGRVEGVDMPVDMARVMRELGGQGGQGGSTRRRNARQSGGASAKRAGASLKSPQTATTPTVACPPALPPGSHFQPGHFSPFMPGPWHPIPHPMHTQHPMWRYPTQLYRPAPSQPSRLPETPLPVQPMSCLTDLATSPAAATSTSNNITLPTPVVSKPVVEVPEVEQDMHRGDRHRDRHRDGHGRHDRRHGDRRHGDRGEERHERKQGHDREMLYPPLVHNKEKERQQEQERERRREHERREESYSSDYSDDSGEGSGSEYSDEQPRYEERPRHDDRPRYDDRPRDAYRDPRDEPPRYDEPSRYDDRDRDMDRDRGEPPRDAYRDERRDDRPGDGRDGRDDNVGSRPHEVTLETPLMVSGKRLTAKMYVDTPLSPEERARLDEVAALVSAMMSEVPMEPIYPTSMQTAEDVNARAIANEVGPKATRVMKDTGHGTGAVAGGDVNPELVPLPSDMPGVQGLGPGSPSGMSEDALASESSDLRGFVVPNLSDVSGSEESRYRGMSGGSKSGSVSEVGDQSPSFRGYTETRLRPRPWAAGGPSSDMTGIAEMARPPGGYGDGYGRSGQARGRGRYAEDSDYDDVNDRDYASQGGRSDYGDEESDEYSDEY